MASTVFLLPGLYNSGPDHWQTHWEKEYGFIRIQQKDCETPVCKDWTSTIDEAVAPYPAGEIILVAHSLACCTVAYWAKQYNRIIKGALLVAPSDVEADSYPPGTPGFMPMSLNKLPFPSIVIASSNDEYVNLERAEYFAACWGSSFEITGALGHLNSSSKLGNWPEGFTWLSKLRD